VSHVAYIKLVPASKKQTITLEELKQLFEHYKNICKKTGEQLGWNYIDSAFPYEYDETAETIVLKGKDIRYRAIEFHVGHENDHCFIQITLPKNATHGDKGKANEFCKFIARQLEGELHLFNGRIMYCYKR
jgi:hypothetical protein